MAGAQAGVDQGRAQLGVEVHVEPAGEGELAQQLAVEQGIAAFAVRAGERAGELGVACLGVPPCELQACAQGGKTPGAGLGEEGFKRLDFRRERLALRVAGPERDAELCQRAPGGVEPEARVGALAGGRITGLGCAARGCEVPGSSQCVGQCVGQGVECGVAVFGAHGRQAVVLLFDLAARGACLHHVAGERVEGLVLAAVFRGEPGIAEPPLDLDHVHLRGFHFSLQLGELRGGPLGAAQSRIEVLLVAAIDEVLDQLVHQPGGEAWVGTGISNGEDVGFWDDGHGDARVQAAQQGGAHGGAGAGAGAAVHQVEVVDELVEIGVGLDAHCLVGELGGIGGERARVEAKVFGIGAGDEHARGRRVERGLARGQEDAGRKAEDQAGERPERALADSAQNLQHGEQRIGLGERFAEARRQAAARAQRTDSFAAAQTRCRVSAKRGRAHAIQSGRMARVRTEARGTASSGNCAVPDYGRIAGQSLRRTALPGSFSTVSGNDARCNSGVSQW